MPFERSAPNRCAPKLTRRRRSRELGTSTGLPESLRSLFPGYALEKIRLPEQRDLVMLHVLTRGGLEHRRWLVQRFGDGGIRRWIVSRKGRGLTVEQMSP
jgi:hypothetical protein